MPAIVLDSFALLAYLRDEPGAEDVAKILDKSNRQDQSILMSVVNYAEVKYIICRKEGVAVWQDVVALLETLPIEFVPIRRDLAETAGDIKFEHGLSLADAFAAALALEKNADLVTGDSEFRSLESQLKIRWL